MARFARQVACKTFGEDRAEFGIKPLMGSEDFSFMLEAQPKGGFLLFGNGDVGEGSCMVHNPVTTLTMQAGPGKQLLGRTG